MYLDRGRADLPRCTPVGTNLPRVHHRITGRTVANAVKPAAEAAGRPHAGHYIERSLRAGHITPASTEGAPDAAIQALSRHESDRAFREYVHPQKLLENMSSAHLLYSSG